jgi:hypothetical protein
MTNGSFDEVVFTVAEATATPAERITLAEAGLTERSHLQEWAIARPEILGPDVLIVTFEFDQWSSASGPQKDRLDILGLGSDGRLVVAELKRGKAPDTVDMQAIKYAAVASRFTEELLAEKHAEYCEKREDKVSEAAALEKLQTHSNVGLISDLLSQPRIVLLAEEFPWSVTSSAVWLNEMGVDLTLLRYQAYRTGNAEVVLTVSQLYPVRQVADFEVAPHSRADRLRQAQAPVVEWTAEDLATLGSIANPTTLAILDLCAAEPDEWVRAADVYEHAGVTMPSGTGQLGGFGLTVRSRFNRSNPPYERKWGADGQAHYRLRPELATVWLTMRESTGSDLTASEPPR